MLKRAFLGWLRGDRDHCKMVAMNTKRSKMTTSKPSKRTVSRSRSELDPRVVERLCAILNPCRERFAFDFTIKHWSALVSQDRSEYKRQTKKQPRSRGRPYDDTGRFAALLLAVIFEEYTGRRPGRTTRWTETDTGKRDKDYPFYQFCREACDAIGMDDITDKAFVEAIAELRGRGQWEANVPALRMLLWGQLRMADAEYVQVRRLFSLALDAVVEGKLLSDMVSAKPSPQIAVRRALIDAVHLREPLDKEELSKADRALERIPVDFTHSLSA
jgi:hypothetical protein